MSTPSDSPVAPQRAEESAWAVRAVEVRTTDGVTLRGEQRGTSPDWAILLHEPGADLDSWRSLPALLAADDFTVLALDLPGHGLTEGVWHRDLLAPTISAAVAYARTAGDRRVFLLGAGLTGTVCLDLARGFAVDAVVGLSPTGLGEGGARRAEPRRPPPALVFAGAQSRDVAAAARQSVAGRGGWTMMSAIPTTHQGTRLLDGAWQRQVQEQIVGFLRQCRR